MENLKKFSAYNDKSWQSFVSLTFWSDPLTGHTLVGGIVFDSTIWRGKGQPILLSSELCYARLSLEFCVIAFRVSAVEWERETIGVYTYRSAGKLWKAMHCSWFCLVSVSERNLSNSTNTAVSAHCNQLVKSAIQHPLQFAMRKWVGPWVSFKCQ